MTKINTLFAGFNYINFVNIVTLFKLPSNKKQTARLKKAYLLCVLFAVLINACSCKRSSDDSNHAYFEKVFAKADSIAAKNYYVYTNAELAYIDSSFAVKKPGIQDIAKRYMYKMAAYNSYNNKPVPDYKTSLIYADSAINLLQNYTDDANLAKFYANVFFKKGDIYFKIRNYDEAIRNYTLGKIVLSSGITDSCTLFSYYTSMATVLYAQQKYLQAAQFYRLKYLSGFNSCMGSDSVLNFSIIQENMDNTGICYAKAGLTDSANYYYNATLNYINENANKFPATYLINLETDRAVVYNNQAEILEQQNDLTGAEKLYLKSIEGSRHYQDATFIIPLKLSLARVYVNTHQFEKAGAVLFDTTHPMIVSEINTIAGDYYKSLADYYSKTNQPLAANNALTQAYKIRDSLENRDREFAAIDVRREFENREQNIANLALQKDNELKNVSLLVAIISALLALVVAFIVWRHLKNKSVYVKQLTALNTEVERKNDDVQKTLASLEQSYKENNRLMRVVAHDLRNPISGIRTLVYSLLKKEQQEPNKNALELIQATCEDSILLIKDLLDNKRNLADISKELVDMGRLIEQCSELLQIKAGEKNQLLKLQLDHPVMMVNRQNIVRVISNIVNNAIKFSPENTEITIRLERKDETVVLSVHDNGIGIPTDLKDKIFTLSPETSREGTAGEESYGLGLSISRKIIEDHEGRLWFESETGMGSVFYVELPYHVN